MFIAYGYSIYITPMYKTTIAKYLLSALHHRILVGTYIQCHRGTCEQPQLEYYAPKLQVYIRCICMSWNGGPGASVYSQRFDLQ